MNFRLIILFGFHVFIGMLCSFFPGLAFYYGTAILLFGIADIIIQQNKDNEAAYWAGYFMGVECFLRMTGSFLSWESGKYGVILLLLVGLFAERLKRPVPVVFVLYGLLLLPSLAVIDFPNFESARQDISFDLSGPASLVTSAFYFYKRKISGETFFGIVRWILYPMIVTILYLIIVTPNLSELEYGTGSNFRASGGFGPNQVSTTLGLGIFLSGICIYYKQKITGSIIADVGLLLLFLIRGLVTFSRGGMVGGVVALGVVMFFGLLLGGRVKSQWKTILYGVFSCILLFFGWNYVNDVSENRLEYRYTGVNYLTGKQKDITSGRLILVQNEVQLFLDNPVFGVGPGMVKSLSFKGNVHANTHSEFTRLIAEHGIFGVLALLIMILSPIYFIQKLDAHFRPMLFGLLVLVLFTMFHSAMRLASPGLLYGLCLFTPLQGAEKNR